MPRKPSPDRLRVVVYLEKVRTKQFKALLDETGLSRTELMNRGVGLYALFHEAEAAGAKMQIIWPDGTTDVVVVVG